MRLVPKSLIALLLTLFLLQASVYAQTAANPSGTDDDFKGWHLKSKETDRYYGINLDKAYSFLQGKKSNTVIVAVIDGGIDTLHEDLRNILWRNTREIAGNGKDDDGNGYADDVFGWNFLGGKDGRSVKEDSYEAARIYFGLKPQFSGLVDPSKLNESQTKEYKTFLAAKADIEKASEEAQSQILFLRNLYSRSIESDSILRIHFKASYTGNELAGFKPGDKKISDAKAAMFTLFRAFEAMENNNQNIITEFTDYYRGQEKKAQMSTTPPLPYRQEIVKDNYNDFNDRFYGNGDVMANNPMHGTHVSGIIAGIHNDVGIRGVANNVRIMTLRAVPDGDEHDKDIALAIRYAVDNGAKVINMSFGKSFSPQKHWVDDAVEYAAKKGVLLIHAAGNEAQNSDSITKFPNPHLLHSGKKASNFITVGASGDPKTGGLAADFSNYGKTEVDVFAPGVKIYSTIPGGNTYGFSQGTSMASPVVAGVAALILQYYPELSPEEVKQCIEKSAAPINEIAVVPGTETEIPFNALSRAGGIVDALEAVLAADALSKSKSNLIPTNQKSPKRNNQP